MEKTNGELSIDLFFYDLFIELQQLIDKEEIQEEKIPYYINQMLKSIKILNRNANRDLFDCNVLKFYLNKMSINREKYEIILKNRLQNITFEKDSLLELKKRLLYMKKSNDYKEFIQILKILVSIFSIQKQRIEIMKNETLKLANPSYLPKDLEESKLKKETKENIKQLKLKKSK